MLATKTINFKTSAVPFDALGYFEFHRLTLLWHLTQKGGERHDITIVSHDGRSVHFVAQFGAMSQSTTSNILTALHDAYDAVATTTAMTSHQDDGTETAMVHMEVSDHSANRTLGYVWQARILRGPSGRMTDYFPIKHAIQPEVSSMPEVAPRPTRAQQAAAQNILDRIPSAEGRWIVES